VLRGLSMTKSCSPEANPARETMADRYHLGRAPAWPAWLRKDLRRAGCSCSPAVA
jgi:hypothetical protein